MEHLSCKTMSGSVMPKKDTQATTTKKHNQKTTTTRTKKTSEEFHLRINFFKLKNNQHLYVYISE
jgi:hypothetical protein